MRTRFVIFEGNQGTRLRMYRQLQDAPVVDEFMGERQLLKLAMDCLIAYVRLIGRKKL